MRRYDLAVAVDPVAKAIRGTNRATVVVVAPLDRFEIQLDDRMVVAAAMVDDSPAAFEHAAGFVTIPLATPWAAGERHSVTLQYAGIPKVARRPPWSDGFVWKETADGRPWVGVTGQGDGGDDWWPCKDHPSDEPDEGMSIALTVPSDLVGLTNGKRISEEKNADGTTTSRWEVTYPINNYLVSVNIAPYVPIEAIYKGIDGTLDERILFWALPEHAEKARVMWKQAPKMLEVLGRRFGEYPFLRDKYWVAEPPISAWEHQTIVAYGADFEDNKFGFDSLLLHETAHEWWGNKITAADWGDFWIHEGFGTYAEAVFVNDTLGVEKYLEYMRRPRQHLANERPIVQGRDITAGAAYIGDIYGKGALVLHTLRYLAGDEVFFRLVHRFANDERYAYRLVSTAHFEVLVAEELGRPEAAVGSGEDDQLAVLGRAHGMETLDRERPETSGGARRDVGPGGSGRDPAAAQGCGKALDRRAEAGGRRHDRLPGGAAVAGDESHFAALAVGAVVAADRHPFRIGARRAGDGEDPRRFDPLAQRARPDLPVLPVVVRDPEPCPAAPGCEDRPAAREGPDRRAARSEGRFARERLRAQSGRAAPARWRRRLR